MVLPEKARRSSAQPKAPPAISSYDEIDPDGRRRRIFKIEGFDFPLCMRWDAEKKPQLHFDLLSLSDLHLVTRHCQAKALSHFLEYTESKILLLLGDIVDGVRAIAKWMRNVAPNQRQAIRRILSKAIGATKVILVPGNHDYKLRPQDIEYKGNGWVSPDGTTSLRKGYKYAYRAVCDRDFMRTKILNERKRFMGVYIVEEYESLMKFLENGREVEVALLADHGDKWEKIHPLWYFLGDNANDFLGFLDDIITIPLVQPLFKTKFLLAEFAKRILKQILKKGMGTIGRIGAAIDRLEKKVLHLSGHTHIPGIDRSPQGNLIVNGGSTTGQECVKGFAVNHGHKALFEWHLDGIKLVDMDNRECFLSFDTPGLECFKASPTPIADAIPNKNKAAFPVKLRDLILAAPRQGLKKAWQASFGKQMPQVENIKEDDEIHRMYRALRMIDFIWPSKAHRRRTEKLRRQAQKFSREALRRQEMAYAKGDITSAQMAAYRAAASKLFQDFAEHVARRRTPDLPDREGPKRAARREEAAKRKAEARGQVRVPEAA